jgi:Zn-dependent peptidase ImmA (M78 family)
LGALLKLLWNKWITPASIQIWLLVAGAFGVLVLVVKMLLMYLKLVKKENKALESEVKRAERIQNVKINNTRDESLKRHRMRGTLRGPDKPL